MLALNPAWSSCWTAGWTSPERLGTCAVMGWAAWVVVAAVVVCCASVVVGAVVVTGAVVVGCVVVVACFTPLETFRRIPDPFATFAPAFGSCAVTETWGRAEGTVTKLT